MSSENALREKMMDHLSKEIIALTESQTAWRTKVNFPIFLGPIVIIGFIFFGEASEKVSLDLGALVTNKWLWPIGGIFLFYGIFCGVIEYHFHRHSQKWRELLAQIYAGQNPDFFKKGSLYEHKAYFISYYTAVYVAIAAQAYFILKLFENMNLKP